MRIRGIPGPFIKGGVRKFRAEKVLRLDYPGFRSFKKFTLVNTTWASKIGFFGTVSSKHYHSTPVYPRNKKPL